MKYYCLISANPVFYISSDSKERLESDYEYIVNENKESYLKTLGITEPYEYSVRSFAELRNTLDTLKQGNILPVYTVRGTKLKKMNYGEPLHLYPDSTHWDFCTYAPDPAIVSDFYALNPERFEKIAKEYLQLKKREDIHTLLNDYTRKKNYPDLFNVTSTQPDVTNENVIGYVCIPIVATKIDLER